MVTRIQVGSEVVAGDDAIASTLNVQHPLGGNLLLFPLGYRVRGNSKSLGEFSLGTKQRENSIEGRVIHMHSLLHPQLNKFNRHLIGRNQPTEENKHMVDMPKPDHFDDFVRWLDAVLRVTGKSKSGLAELAGVRPQAVTKWFDGGNVGPKPLQRIADWAGADYMQLRALLEQKPLVDSKARKGIKQPGVDAQRIARKIDLLHGDETSISAIEALVDTLVNTKTKGKPRRVV